MRTTMYIECDCIAYDAGYNDGIRGEEPDTGTLSPKASCFYTLGFLDGQEDFVKAITT